MLLKIKYKNHEIEILMDHSVYDKKFMLNLRRQMGLWKESLSWVYIVTDNGRIHSNPTRLVKPFSILNPFKINRTGEVGGNGKFSYPPPFNFFFYIKIDIYYK